MPHLRRGGEAGVRRCRYSELMEDFQVRERSKSIGTICRTSGPGKCCRLIHRPNYFFFCAPMDSSARSPGVCASFESTLPLRASTWTAAIFLVKGVTISIDQISWPFSCASFALLTFPPGTFVSAAFSACARVIRACKLGDVGGLSVAKVVP